MTGKLDDGESAEGVREKLSDDMARLKDELEAIDALDGIEGAIACHFESRGEKDMGIASAISCRLFLKCTQYATKRRLTVNKRTEDNSKVYCTTKPILFVYAADEVALSDFSPRSGCVDRLERVHEQSQD